MPPDIEDSEPDAYYVTTLETRLQRVRPPTISTPQDLYEPRRPLVAGADRVAEHRRVGKGERSIVEAHVAALRRPRFERMRARAGRSSKTRSRDAELAALVAWPRIEVVHRPIEEYAAAVGGAR